jgi:hypothetical protein
MQQRESRTREIQNIDKGIIVKIGLRNQKWM